jgi:predicted RNase H-like nuclease (RuvC/YqgF family)
MEPKYSKIFNNTILDSVQKYCELNKIDDIDGFIRKCFDSGFNIEKYGLLGKTLNEGEKDLKTSGVQEKRAEIEVIREIRVEVPVEVIKEIEKIVEVPVEKVVTKIEYISDKNTENELGGIITKLEENIFQLNQDLEKERQIFSTKTTELENNFQNEMAKKDQELDELRRSLDIKLDDSKTKMLQETLQKLRSEMLKKDEKIKELERINQELENTKQPLKGVFMRGSNLNDTL